ISYSHDGPTPLGTGGAIRKALPTLGDRFFVLYGDSYLPCDYAGVQQAFRNHGTAALMTIYENEGRWDSSNVEFQAGRIVTYDKVKRTERMKYIDYGLGVFHASAFADIPEGTACDLAEVYQRLLAQNQLSAFVVTERFYEVGSFSGIKELEK